MGIWRPTFKSALRPVQLSQCPLQVQIWVLFHPERLHWPVSPAFLMHFRHPLQRILIIFVDCLSFSVIICLCLSVALSLSTSLALFLSVHLDRQCKHTDMNRIESFFSIIDDRIWKRGFQGIYAHKPPLHSPTNRSNNSKQSAMHSCKACINVDRKFSVSFFPTLSNLQI